MINLHHRFLWMSRFDTKKIHTFVNKIDFIPRKNHDFREKINGARSQSRMPTRWTIIRESQT